jgi:hypothetical protein
MTEIFGATLEKFRKRKGRVEDKRRGETEREENWKRKPTRSLLFLGFKH